MEAYILQNIPSERQFQGINACRRNAWERDFDYYPYHAFGIYESWQESGELGQAIQNRELYASLVEAEGEVVAHAALVKNKFGIELGRVFSQIGGHGYGIQAVDKAREHAELLGLQEIQINISYNRTAMARAYEETFAQNGWRLAILGLLPDIYQEHDMQWGELISRAIKDGNLELPPISFKQPKILQHFALEMQRLNNHCVEFGKNVISEALLPYQFSDSVYAISWDDFSNQQKYIAEGYQPVGLIPLQGQWHFVMFYGELPMRIEGRGSDLRTGRNPVIYPKEVAGRPVGEILDVIYEE